MIYLFRGSEPTLLCVYQKDGYLTLHYTPLPLDATTDLENIWGTAGSELKVQKIMMDGQLYILHENGLYHVTGTRVE